MFDIRNHPALWILISMFFIYSAEHQMPFHLRFYGTTSNGLELVNQQSTITYGTAVNLCSKLCKTHWWCSALRKCADRPRLFQCDVICPMTNIDTGIHIKGKERCVPIKAQEISPNVAAHKTVTVIGKNHVFYPRYATDTPTICPLNRLFVHTIFAPDPWLQIFFGQSVDVAMVVVYNRQDAGPERFHNALFEVAENNVWRPCGFYNGPGVINQIIFIICNEAVR